MAIKTTLKQHRLRMGMSQAQVAKKVGLSQTGYQRRETGLIQVKTSELDKFSKLFQVAVADLIQQTTEPEEGDGDMVYWEREYYKLLGVVEFMHKLLEGKGFDFSFPAGVGIDGEKPTPMKRSG